MNEHYWRYASVNRAERDRAIEAWNQPTRWPIYVLFGLATVVFGWGFRKRRTTP